MTLEEEMQQWEDEHYAAEYKENYTTGEEKAEFCDTTIIKSHTIATCTEISGITTNTNSITNTPSLSDTTTANNPSIVTKSWPKTINTTDTNKVIKTPIFPTPTSNNCYYNIDNEILQTEYEGTIVFEDDPSAPTTITNKRKNQQKKVFLPKTRTPKE